MKKETLADKLAKKAFQSAKVQDSWAVHMQAFGPILGPAFLENDQARIHLTEALNRLSKRNIKGGMDKLMAIKDACETDADRAAWSFFMGLGFEFVGAKDQMLACYQQAGEFGHKFYLPYLKVAKNAHQDAAFDVAEEQYRKGIACLDEKTPDEQSKIILASSYSNLASCLIMMHRLEEAEVMLEKSIAILPRQRGRCATAAILRAAQEHAEQAATLMEHLAEESPEIVESTKKTVDEILRKEHPQFYPVPVEASRMDEFWAWFTEQQYTLWDMLQGRKYDDFFAMIQPQLAKLFPFAQRDLDLGIEPGENTYHLIFADYYMKALEVGYTELLERCPAALSPQWSFALAH